MMRFLALHMAATFLVTTLPACSARDRPKPTEQMDPSAPSDEAPSDDSEPPDDAPDASDPVMSSADGGPDGAADAGTQNDVDSGCPGAAPTLARVSLPARALAGDPRRGRVYAVLGAAEPYRNQLVTIDAARAMVVHTVEVGSAPTSLAISDDASTLWVGLSGSAELRRVDLQGAFPVPGQRYPVALNGIQAEPGELVVLPQQADNVAVSLQGSNPLGFAGLVLLESGVLRPVGRDNHSSRLAAGPNGFLFGFDHETSEHSFYTVDLRTPESDAAPHTGLVYDFPTDISYDPDGFVYATSGALLDVRDPRAPVRAGVFAYSGAVLPRAGTDIALMVSIEAPERGSLVLRHLDTRTVSQLAQTPLGALDAHTDFVTDLVQTGPRNLAFLAGSREQDSVKILLASSASDLFCTPIAPRAVQPVVRGDLTEVPIEARALVADRVRSRLYATVGGGAKQFENRLVTIDPSTGAIIHDVPVGSDPDVLAISDDASTLWVGLSGSYQIRRVDLGSGWPVPAPATLLPKHNDEPTFARSLVLLPGTQRSLAAAVVGPRLYPAPEVIVFDDAVPRVGAAVSDRSGPDQLSAGPSGRLFGFGRLSSAYPFFSLSVTSSGAEQTEFARLVHGEGAWITYDPDGFVYASSGMVVDVRNAAAPRRAGAFAYTGGVLPLAGSETALMVSGPMAQGEPPLLRSLDSQTFTQRGATALALSSPFVGVPRHVVHLESDVLGFVADSSAGAASVYLVAPRPVAAARAMQNREPAQLTPALEGDLSELGLAARALIADPVRPRFYATVAGDAPSHANRLVAIDAQTMTILASIAIGSDPDEMAVSDDGSTLWVSIAGSYELRRVDLASASRPVPGPSYPLRAPEQGMPVDVASMVTLPGRSGSLVVSLRDSLTSPSAAGVVVLDDGAPRSLSLPFTEGVTSLTVGPSDFIFGQGGNSAGAIFALGIGADGVTMREARAGLVACCAKELRYDRDGFVYASSGEIVDVRTPAAPVAAGTFPFSGSLLPLAGNDRVLMVSEDAAAIVLRVLSKSAHTQLSVRTLLPSGARAPSHLVGSANHGLAFIAGARSGSGVSVYRLNTPALFN